MEKESQPTTNPEEETQERIQRQKELVRKIQKAWKAKDPPKLRTLMEELATISLPQPEKGEIFPEVLSQNQALYNWLGIEVDLQKEYQEGRLLLPSPEQQEGAEKAGYTFPLIVLGHLPRKELLAKVREKYASEFHSQGVLYGEQAQKDLPQTEQVQHSSRPVQSYLILLKPQREVRDAHPETMGKSALQAQEILENLQKENPGLNLQGLTLEEYLLAQAFVCQENQEHLEEETWTWLLEEKVREQGNWARCLSARWNPVTSWVGVGSYGVSDADSSGGARFAAVPTFAEASAGKPESSP